MPTSSPSQQRGQDFLLCFFRGAGGKQWKVREFHGKWECNGNVMGFMEIYGDLVGLNRNLLGFHGRLLGTSWDFMGFHQQMRQEKLV